MKFFFLVCIILISLLGLAFFMLRQRRVMLQPGDSAPQFTLQDETGAWRSLAEFKGKNIVLYFYPHDDTPGCTKQACSFRDSASRYAENNIVVLGINFDSPESHARFKEKYHLPFTLLSDTQGKVAKAYGAQLNVPFAQNVVPARITFLIDAKGTIIKRLHDIDVSTYADTVLKEFGIE